MVGVEDATIGVVDTLRQDTDVTNALYVDSTVPSNVDDRDRVYIGAATEPNNHPVEVAVMPIADSSNASKSVVTKVMAFNCTVVATETWYQEYQSLRLLKIFDAMDDVNALAPTDYLFGQGREGGRAGGSEGIQVETDTGRRAFGGRWRFRTSETRY